MTTTTLTRRLAAAVAIAVLGFGPLAACSSDNVDCTLNACTVTFERGVDAKSEVLGVDVKLVGVQDGNVQVEIGGQTVNVPVDGSAEAEGFKISVEEVTDDQVVLKVEQSG